MELFSPQIINESNAITLFQSDPLTTCRVRQNAGVAIKFVEPTGNESFMGTLTLYVSQELEVGTYTVYCRVSINENITDTDSTTFSVVGKKILYG